jgi:hypothetical protein
VASGTLRTMPAQPVSARRLLVPVSIVLLAVVSACGGGGGGDGVATLEKGAAAGATTDTTLSSEDAEKALVDWTTCMREHGVDIPDPTTDKDGNVSIAVGRAGDDGNGSGNSGSATPAAPPDRDAFDAARTDCGEPPLQGGGPVSKEDREAFQEQALKFAQCMRDEGVTAFPDPDFSADGPGAGPVLRSEAGGDSPERSGPFGEIDIDDPAVQKAFETCQKATGGKGGPVIRTGPGGAASASGSANASVSSDS